MPPEGKKELNQVGVGGIKSLRTYQSDIADALGQNNVTMAKIAIAENVKKVEQEVKNTPKTEAPKAIKIPEVISNRPVENHHVLRNLVYFFLGIIFIGSGALGAFYFYSKSPISKIGTPFPQGTRYQGILASNTQKKILLGSLIDKRLEDVLIYEKSQTKLEPGQISELYFTQGTTEEPVLINAETFITLTTTRSPESVRRSLLEKFMFGFHQTSSTTEPYIVLKTDFFQNTFTGMLKWEPDMYDDIKSWFSHEAKANDKFEDKVIKNKDVRILRDINGEILILYCFLDKETLLITTNQETLFEIMDRFEKQSYMR